MSIQAAFNADAMSLIPKIKEVISFANNFEANQMEHKALTEMMDSPIPIAHMNSKQLEQFQTDLLDQFKYYDWI